MIRFNRRRVNSAYLGFENGKITSTSPENLSNIKARPCDISDMDISDVESQQDVEMGNNDEGYETPESRKDRNERDMKVAVFNILRTCFAFCVIGIIGLLLYKTLPVTIETTKNYFTNGTQKVEKPNSNQTVGLTDKEKKGKYEIIKNSMLRLKEINNSLNGYYEKLSNYTVAYSTNKADIYNYVKIIKELKVQVDTDYLRLLNTESEYKESHDQEFFKQYQSRYENLQECLETFSNETNYNRKTVIEILNSHIEKDNKFNEKEFDVLIEYFNKYEISYTIDESSIILNEIY